MICTIQFIIIKNSKTFFQNEYILAQHTKIKNPAEEAKKFNPFLSIFHHVEGHLQTLFLWFIDELLTNWGRNLTKSSKRKVRGQTFLKLWNLGLRDLVLFILAISNFFLSYFDPLPVSGQAINSFTNLGFKRPQPNFSPLTRSGVVRV